MPEPNDRRIIFSNQVISKEEYVTEDLQEELEDGDLVGQESYLKEKIDTNLNKKLGGKGIVSINTDQGGTTLFWEDIGINWEDTFTLWEGTMDIDGRSLYLTQNLSDPNPLAFLYIKNLGERNNVGVWLNDNTRDTTLTFGGRDASNFGNESRTFRDDYTIKIPPKASISLRINGDVQDCDDVQVSSVGDDGLGTVIEYIVALAA